MEGYLEAGHELTAQQQNALPTRIPVAGAEKHGIRIMTDGRTLTASQRDFLRQLFRSTILRCGRRWRSIRAIRSRICPTKRFVFVVSCSPRQTAANRDSVSATGVHPRTEHGSLRFIKLPSLPGRQEFILLDEALSTYIHELLLDMKSWAAAQSYHTR